MTDSAELTCSSAGTGSTYETESEYTDEEGAYFFCFFCSFYTAVAAVNLPN